MKYLSYLFVLTALLWSNKSIAYDIEVDGFYYNVLSATTLEVTYGDKKYSGNISIPATVTYNGKTYDVVSVGTKAFAECDKLLSIYMGNNIKSIGDQAFYKCSSLKDYSFSNCKLGLYVFAYCTSLKNGDISGDIPQGTFYGCTSIESLSPKYRSIGPYAYAGCTSIKGNIDIRGGYTNEAVVGGSAFAGCIGITNVLLRANVDLCIDAFVDCPSLETVFMSDNDSGSEYTYIVGFGKAFGKCKNLKNVEIEKFGNRFFYENGSIYRRAYGATVYYLDYVLPNVSVYVTPDWLSHFGPYAFSSIGKLRRVVLSNNLKSINLDAFRNCPDLKEIYCYSKTPTFPFTGEDLVPKLIPELKGKLKFYVPQGCKQNFKGWIWDDLIIEEFDVINFDPYEISEEVDGIKYKITSDTEVEVAHKDDYSGDIVIPETVTLNDKEYKVTSIGKDAFRLSPINTISIPNSVINIGEGAFFGSKITSIGIPNNITTIENNTFNSCYSLKSIILPNNVVEIGENAFCSCSELESVELPHNLRKIGPGSFYYCRKLKKIVIPEKLERISAFAFRNCDNLETIIIPNEITSIGNAAFAHCFNIKSIILGENIRSIGKAAFQGCPSLENIYILNRTPPTLNVEDNDYNTKMLDDINTTFHNGWYLMSSLYTYKTATLWVSESCLDEYKNHYDWGQFVNIQTFDPNTFNPSALGIKTITNDEEEMKDYSLDGIKISTPSKGINIIKMKDGTVKKVLVK